MPRLAAEQPESFAVEDAAPSLPNVTFDQVLTDTQNLRRHLLLGNGFSIAANARFKYETLVERACDDDPYAAHLFGPDRLWTFEQAMRMASERDRERLRSLFAQTLVGMHPQRAELGPWPRSCCRDFLVRFFADATFPGTLFTTNYDAMLTWVLVEHQEALGLLDGFREAETRTKTAGFPTKLFVTNEARIGSAGQTHVVYLHGALHLFDTHAPKHSAARKLLGGQVGEATLIDNMRTEVAGGRLPIMIAEGTAPEKRRKIDAHPYLSAALRRFEGACNGINQALVILGHSLSETDHHLLKLIARGDVQDVFIGVHVEADRRRAARVTERWQQARSEHAKPAIRVRTFDTADAQVWDT